MGDDTLSNQQVYDLLSKRREEPTTVVAPETTTEEQPAGVADETEEQEPLGREAAFLRPWSDDERRAFQAHARSQHRNAESMSEAEGIDWLRRHRGLPQIQRPEQPPMRWISGAYGGRKSIRDFEDESRTLDSNSFQGVERPGSRNLNGRGV